MGSIRVLYATVGRRKAFFDVTDGGLDALVPSSSIPSPHPKRQRGRGGSSHRGGRRKGKGMAGNGDERTCHLFLCTKGLPPHSSGDTGSSTTANSSFDSAASSNTTTASSDPVSSQTTSISSGLSDPASTVLPTLTSAPSSPANESSGPSSISAQGAAAATGSKKTGAIAGGVLGGLAFILLLILGAILFLRRRRRKRTPASAEFRDRYIPRSTAPPPPLRHPLAAQTSRESFDPDGDGDGAHDFAEMRYHPSEAPPPFTKGSFNDPLFEKIYETQQKNLEYGLAS